MNECLLCLGSNINPIEYLTLSREFLKLCFTDIIIADEIQTKPIGLKRKDFFINQVLYLKTDLTQDDVIRILKDIEIKCGRKLEDKKSEIVRIDIDLLVYNDIVLKPVDLNREYVQQGIKHISSILNK